METTLWKLMINCWILTVCYCGHAELAGTTEGPALVLNTTNNGRMEPKSFEVYEDQFDGDFPKFEEFAASAAKEFEFFRFSKFDDFKDSEDKASATIEGFTAVETTTQTVDSSTPPSNRKKRPGDRNTTQTTPKSSKPTFLDHKGEGSSLVATKLAPHQPFPAAVENGEELDGQTYLGTEEEPLPLRSLSIVTEISVQETKDGQTIKRKPTEEELRFLQQDLEEKHLEQNSIGNERPTKEDQVEDLESMLKSDDEADFESWSDDDEEPSDMEAILKSPQPPKPAGKEAEPAKAQEAGPEQGAKKGPDDGDYRKIFHTERKNFSNVQEVKIVISETEGDFFDDEEPFDMMKPFMKLANGTNVSNSSQVNELDGQVTEVPFSSTEGDLLVLVTTTEEKAMETPTEANAVQTTTEVPAESTEKITTTTPETTTEEITTSTTTTTTTTTTTRTLLQSEEVVRISTKEIEPEDIISPHVLSELMSLIKDDSFPKSSQRPDIKVSSTSIEPRVVSRTTPEYSTEAQPEPSTTTPTLQPTPQQPTTQVTVVEPPSPAFTLKLLNEFSTFLSTEFPLGMSPFDGFQPSTTQASPSTVAPKAPAAGSFAFKRHPTSPGNFDEDFEADDFFTEFPDPFETKEEGYDFDDLTPGEVESMFNEKLEDYEPFEDDEYDAVQKAQRKKPKEDWDRKKSQKVAEDRSGTEVPNEVTSKKTDLVDIKTEQVALKDSFVSTEIPKAASSTENDVLNITTLGPISEVPHDVDVKVNEIDTENVEILVPVLKARILNNTALFSIRINHKGDIYHIPETAHIKEMPNLVNITWRTTMNQNNSVAFKIGENDASYTIEEIVINLLKGDQFNAQQTGVQPRPIDEQAHIIMMKDGTQITISNVDFLKKKTNSTVNIKGKPKASLREAKLWHVEVASICLVTVIVIASILYVIAIKTKPKIILRGKDDVPQVTHC